MKNKAFIRRILSLVAVCVILVNTCISSVYAVSVDAKNRGEKMGDVNGDGFVSSDDARSILRYSVGLDELSKSEIAYANVDMDDSVSSADARLALRTSVSLEEVEYHLFSNNGNTYTCTICDAAFTIKEAHVHKYVFVTCYEPLTCECGAVSGSAVGHNISKSTKKCTNCSFSVAEATAAVNEYLDMMDKISENSNDALLYYKNGNYYDFFNSIMDVCLLYGDAATLFAGIDLLEDVYDNYYEAYSVLYDAIDAVTDYDGMITTNVTNANYVVSNGVLIALDYEKAALEYLKLFIQTYKDYL